jgi:predicted acyltransferase
LLLAYWGLMEWVRVDDFGGGSYEQATNLAEWVDRTVLGRFRDAAQVGDDGRVVFASWYHYTWILSTLNFGAPALTGVFAGLIARNAWGGMLKVLAYAGFGVAMLALGLVWGEAMPIIKTIWTSSMVLFSSGLCFLLMGLFFFIYDVCHLSLGLNFLKVYGMNSIVAYVISEVVNFRCMAHSVFWGLEQYLGAYYPCLLTFCQILIVFTILRLMYKNEVFVKV